MTKEKPILDTPLRIYTAVWGTKHLELFEKTILRSFLWNENNAALLRENVTWSLHTNKKDSARLIQLCKRTGIENYELTEITHPTEGIIELQGGHPDIGAILLNNFKSEISRCLDTNARLLLAPPDSLFGDGTLNSLFSIGSQDGVCVAVPHPRTLPSIFEYPSRLCESLKDTLTNAELVTETFRNLHKTWSEAEVGFDKINSYVGGVMWRKLSHGLYSVQHRLPTNYLLHFIPSDLQFFEQQICFGAIDHLWPTKLIKEERERVIGSSDAAFICEVTEAHQNIPPAYPYVNREPDRFWRSAHHNIFFRQVNCIFRGV